MNRIQVLHAEQLSALPTPCARCVRRAGEPRGLPAASASRRDTNRWWVDAAEQRCGCVGVAAYSSTERDAHLVGYLLWSPPRLVSRRLTLGDRPASDALVIMELRVFEDADPWVDAALVHRAAGLLIGVRPWQALQIRSTGIPTCCTPPRERLLELGFQDEPRRSALAQNPLNLTQWLRLDLDRTERLGPPLRFGRPGLPWGWWAQPAGPLHTAPAGQALAGPGPVAPRGLRKADGAQSTCGGQSMGPVPLTRGLQPTSV